MIRGLGLLLLLLALTLTLGLHPLQFLRNELVRSGYQASLGALGAPAQGHPYRSGLDMYLRRRFRKINPALESAGPPRHKDVIDAVSPPSGSVLPVPSLIHPLLKDSAGNMNRDLFKLVPGVIRP